MQGGAAAPWSGRVGLCSGGFYGPERNRRVAEVSSPAGHAYRRSWIRDGAAADRRSVMNAIAITQENSSAQTQYRMLNGSRMPEPGPIGGEQQLFARLRQRDAAAFDELVVKHHGALIRMAMGHVADRETAEEVIQDTWMAVIEG